MIFHLFLHSFVFFPFVNGLLKFWQISDLHVDFKYDPKGDPKNFCHLSSTSSSSSSSKEQYNEGEFGNFLCDGPWILSLASLTKMAEIEPNPDFILWTGDSFPHYNDNWTSVYDTIQLISKTLRTLFPNTLILPVLGNHDSYPSNTYVENSDFYKGYLNQGGWKDLIPIQSSILFKKCGYYSHELTIPENKEKLVFLNLNTNLYYKNKGRVNNTEDPCFQLSWIREQLEKGLLHQSRILIVSHVPPGFFELSPQTPFFTDMNSSSKLNDDYSDLMSNKRYSKVIGAHFYGHTHTNTFRLFMESKSQTEALGVAFISSSITPLVATFPILGVVGVNPGFRFYTYDFERNIVENYQEYILPLDSLKKLKGKNSEFENLVKNTTDEISSISSSTKNSIQTESFNNTRTNQKQRPNSSDILFLLEKIKLGFDAQESFNISNLSPSQMLLALSKLEGNDSRVFDLYVKHNTNSHNLNYICDKLCKTQHTCSIRYLKALDLKKCLLFQEFPSSKETQTSNELINGFLILILVSLTFVSISLLIILILKRRQMNSFASQEFLFSNSLTKYDGYSDLEIS